MRPYFWESSKGTAVNICLEACKNCRRSTVLIFSVTCGTIVAKQMVKIRKLKF